MPALPNETVVDIYQISNNALSYITSVKQFIPLSSESILTYSKELSDYGQCKFRISSYDPMFKQYGDILQPHVNHIRINRGGNLVWAGAIIENTKRTKDYVEIVGAEYEWYLDRILVNRTSVDASGTGPSLQISNVSGTPSGAGTNVTFTFNSNFSAITPVAPAMGVAGSLSVSGFSSPFTALDGIWPIVSLTANSVTFTINVPQGFAGWSTYLASNGQGSFLFADNIYRTFGYGSPGVNEVTLSMGNAVTDIINETITNYKNVTGLHPLANLTIGTITTPNYPTNITNSAATPAALTGPYLFGDSVDHPQMQFVEHTVLYVLKSMGAVSYADFNIDENLAFNFEPFMGSNLVNTVSFSYALAGNAVDFNWPRLGQLMANDLIGIATDISGAVLQSEQSDQASIASSGIIQKTAAYADVKDQATLNAAVAAELPLISNPTNSPITFTLNEKAYPLGVYDIADIVSCSVTTDALTIPVTPKRIVGITVNINNQGRESITAQLNNPLPGQLGGSGN